MQQNKQKGSAVFIVIVIIGLILVTQYNLQSIFESKQFKDNMAYLQSIPTRIIKVFVIDPTVADLKNKASGIGITQQAIDDLNKGKLPSFPSINLNSFDSMVPMYKFVVPTQAQNPAQNQVSSGVQNSQN